MDAAKPGHYQFLLLEPRREVRLAWLARWRRFNSAAAKEIKEQVKARWAMRKAEK
jgi:hypothetical protein